MKKSVLIKKLSEIPDDVEMELLMCDKKHNQTRFAKEIQIVEYGRDPTMKTIRLCGIEIL